MKVLNSEKMLKIEGGASLWEACGWIALGEALGTGAAVDSAEFAIMFNLAHSSCMDGNYAD